MIRRMVLALFCGLAGAVQAQAQSAYGCSNLPGRGDLPVVEGLNGVFFRVQPDLRNFFDFSDQTVERLGEFSDALAANGTRLILLPVPTKSLAMPGSLTAETEDFGFDPDLATTVYLDIVKRLEDRGIATADARRAMVQAQASAPAYFQVDHRWTVSGARLAAQAVAARLSGVTGGQGAQIATRQGDEVVLPSHMYAQIQQHCQMMVPPVATPEVHAQGPNGVQRPEDTSLFSGLLKGGGIAVVGTEYTGEPVTNFPALLAEATGQEVGHYTVEGGGAFAAISSYLTSPAFRAARPAALVWEMPVVAELAHAGDQPMRELIAMAGDTCTVSLKVFSTPGTDWISVDLEDLDPAQDHTLFLDAAGVASREARFIFRARNGETRARTILRHPGQVHNGRFAMPLSGLWPEGAVSVEIELLANFGTAPRVLACTYSGKG
ncbi:alginate O-acetyltransferase AlgX-related protein [Oceaniglobus trochenteri]|uniref:alginate O-acetyltransferase AlgX-related protein n=1 Tax=Oceaniglobus trochenteri TaxID=2763260 RepID=UPI001D000236|nr:hypothetical protein [Oceaniglobus trochenteri]